MFGRRGYWLRGPLLPPFSSDPLIKSFHFWPRLRPASHRYQKSERARRASIHISIPFSIVGHGEEFMPLEPVIIFAIGESHCSSLCFSVPRFSFEKKGEEERKVTMPKNVLVTATKRRRRRRRGNLFGRYANAVPYANMVDSLSCLQVIIHVNLMGIT